MYRVGLKSKYQAREFKSGYQVCNLAIVNNPSKQNVNQTRIGLSAAKRVGAYTYLHLRPCQRQSL